MGTWCVFLAMGSFSLRTPLLMPLVHEYTNTMGGSLDYPGTDRTISNCLHIIHILVCDGRGVWWLLTTSCALQSADGMHIVLDSSRIALIWLVYHTYTAHEKIPLSLTSPKTVPNLIDKEKCAPHCLRLLTYWSGIDDFYPWSYYLLWKYAISKN